MANKFEQCVLKDYADFLDNHDTRDESFFGSLEVNRVDADADVNTDVNADVNADVENESTFVPKNVYQYFRECPDDQIMPSYLVNYMFNFPLNVFRVIMELVIEKGENKLWDKCTIVMSLKNLIESSLGNDEMNGNRSGFAPPAIRTFTWLLGIVSDKVSLSGLTLSLGYRVLCPNVLSSCCPNSNNFTDS